MHSVIVHYPILSKVFSAGGGHLAGLTEVCSDANFNDDTNEDIVLSILKLLNVNCHMTGKERELFLTRIIGSNMVNIDEILDQINVTKTTFIDTVINNSTKSWYVRKYVIYARLCKLITTAFMMKSKPHNKLTICLMLALLLDGFPSYLVDNEFNEPKLFSMARIINSQVCTSENIQAYHAFDELIKALKELFNRKVSNAAERQNVYDAIDVGVVIVIVHMLIICLRKHQQLDSNVSLMIWKDIDLDESEKSKLLSSELSRSLNIVL